MSYGAEFIYAEDARGRIVHVDEVPRGLRCGCHCPRCGEPLQARQGDERSHGFKHHSKDRRANLKICYEVVRYKLAEQIIADNKRITVPSYYGIFPGKTLDFIEVKVDSCYEREDKQPDVIAKTADGVEYLIEFVFSSKVQHKQPIDYKNTNCLEIDLKDQTMETLKDFLTSEPTDAWKWLNNDVCFTYIEERYKAANKNVRVMSVAECKRCELKNCIGIRQKSGILLTVYNNGQTYRICKLDLYQQALEQERQEKEREEVRKQEDQRCIEKKEQLKRLVGKWNELINIAEEKQFQEQEERTPQLEDRQKRLEAERLRFEAFELLSERSCFNCKYNLRWKNRNGYASCGSYKRLQIPESTPPNYAQECKNYIRGG